MLCCAPLQRCAIVTASRSIPKQAGVYQNLLGSEVFAPLSHRQALLSNLLSDKCSCPRCRDEVSFKSFFKLCHMPCNSSRVSCV